MLLIILQNFKEKIEDDPVQLNKDICVKSCFCNNDENNNDFHDEEKHDGKSANFDQIVLKMLDELSVKEEKEVYCKALKFEDEEEFHPELFGLLEDPGVLRFECVDYPQAAIEMLEENVSEENLKIFEKRNQIEVRIRRCDSLNNHDRVRSKR